MKKLLALVALVSAACGPSINPQMKSTTDSMLASIKGGHSEGAPSSSEPMPWAEGQWILMRTTNAKQQPSVMKLGVVGREGGGFWIETDTQDYFHRNWTKVLYSRMPRSAEEAADAMLKMVMKTDDKEPVVYDFTNPNDPMAAFTKTAMKSFAVGGVVLPAQITAGAEEVTVPAGTFKGCAKFDVTFAIGPMSKKATSWYHPAVPINGGVKSVSEDGEWTTELLDYGLTGATSSL